MARKPRKSPIPSDTEDLTTTAPPSSIDPYAVLSVPSTATTDQIRTAYRRAALKHHPDKATDSDKDTANQKFQEVAFAYAILSDERRRKRYDDTGNTAETIDGDEDFDWVDFFRSQKGEFVDGNMIEKIKREYQGSAEEKADVLRCYTEARGDMDHIYEEVMLSNVVDDDERFRRIIDEAIREGGVQGFKAYVKEEGKKKRQRVRKAKAEEAEAVELAEELDLKEKLFGNGDGKSDGKGKNGAGEEDALKALIQGRQKDRASGFLQKMEEKYAGAGGGKKTKGKRTVEEPPEELFAKNAKKAKAK